MPKRCIKLIILHFSVLSGLTTYAQEDLNVSVDTNPEHYTVQWIPDIQRNVLIHKETKDSTILDFKWSRPHAVYFIPPYPLLRIKTSDMWTLARPDGTKIMDHFHYLRPAKFGAVGSVCSGDWFCFDSVGNILSHGNFNANRPPDVSSPINPAQGPRQYGGSIGLLGDDGKWLLPPPVDAYEEVTKSIYKVYLAGKWGAIDSEGTWIVPCVHSNKNFVVPNMKME